MISWLKGESIDKWKNGQRIGLVIACSGVGYEVQVLSKQISLMESNKDLALWVHQIHREDNSSLYGFLNIEERNVFRKLIGISGIGPQIAISLLNDHSLNELITIIISEDIASLTKSHGVGKRVAERLTVELRDQLNDFQLNPSDQNKSISTKEQNKDKEYNDKVFEVKLTLEGLGYEEDEINSAINDILIDLKTNDIEKFNQTDYIKQTNIAVLTKDILVRLSQNNHINGS